MADQFCLRWNNFQSNIVSALDSLKCSEDLVDVTLTCEGRNIKAHKVILSACSPYFRNVFKAIVEAAEDPSAYKVKTEDGGLHRRVTDQISLCTISPQQLLLLNPNQNLIWSHVAQWNQENPCQHPVIILKDVSADDIVNLLSYMYQGEVFIEESKLTSFLHTAALLQVKGLTGVTQQRENISNAHTNKLYTHLTISSKSQYSGPQGKVPGLKKRRSSTSDKPSDVTIGDGHKKSKILETCDIYNKNNNYNSTKVDNTVFTPENNIDKKCDGTNEQSHITANGKNSTSRLQGDNIPIIVKTERIDENDSPIPSLVANSENDDSPPDYVNSMLARSLLSGINPSKSDISANTSIKKVSNILDIHCTTRPKEPSTDTITFTHAVTKSPLKSSSEETLVKPEKMSPKHDIEYEPEVVLTENQDDSDENTYQEQTQAIIMMGPVMGSGASTSQGISHQQQSNHAAICGDCPHCGMKYSNQSALKYHVRLMHSDLTNRLCCYLCPRSFTMRETFKEHMWTSHGQRN